MDTPTSRPKHAARAEPTALAAATLSGNGCSQERPRHQWAALKESAAACAVPLLLKLVERRLAFEARLPPEIVSVLVESLKNLPSKTEAWKQSHQLLSAGTMDEIRKLKDSLGLYGHVGKRAELVQAFGDLGCSPNIRHSVTAAIRFVEGLKSFEGLERRLVIVQKDLDLLLHAGWAADVGKVRLISQFQPQTATVLEDKIDAIPKEVGSWMGKIWPGLMQAFGEGKFRDEHQALDCYAPFRITKALLRQKVVTCSSPEITALVEGLHRTFKGNQSESALAVCYLSELAGQGNSQALQVLREISPSMSPESQLAMLDNLDKVTGEASSLGPDFIKLFDRAASRDQAEKLCEALHGGICEEGPGIRTLVAICERALPELKKHYLNPTVKSDDITAAVLSAIRAGAVFGESKTCLETLKETSELLSREALNKTCLRLRREALFCISALAVSSDPEAKTIGSKIMQRLAERSGIRQAGELFHKQELTAADVEQLLNKTGTKISFSMLEVSDIHALRGLLKALPLEQSGITLSIRKREKAGQDAEPELTPQMLQEAFPGCTILDADKPPGERDLRFSFHDVRGLGWHSSMSLPKVPLKFGLPDPLKPEDAAAMRRELNVGLRPILVAGSVTIPDATSIARDLAEISRAEGGKPLLIVAVRDARMVPELIKALPKELRIAQRTASERGQRMKSCDQADVLIVSTQGELLKLYAVADLTVVGHDRHVLEPGSQGRAALAMPGRWKNNRRGLEALRAAGGAELYSADILKRLLANRLSANQMGQRGLDVVQNFKRQQIPAVAAQTAQIIALLALTGELLRK